MEWNTLGRSVSNETMEDKAFCYHKEYKILRMPLKWSWNNGNHVCKKVGQMYGDFSSLEYLIRKLTFGNLEDCQFIWTSYKYIADNKTIINQNNKEIIDYKYDQEKILSFKYNFSFRKHSWIWTQGFPLVKYSNIVLYIIEKTFSNKASSYEHCIYCMIPRKRIFNLRGICKRSLLGTSTLKSAPF